MVRLIIAFLIISSLFISCDNNDPVLTGYGSVELVFKARFGTEPIVYGNAYNYFDLGTIVFGKTDFFYSSMKLLNDKDSILIKDVDYVSMMDQHTTVALAEEGLKVIYDRIPTGNYNSFNFNIGLTPEQNKTKPSDYQFTHPLGEGSRYWSGWISYIYSKTEGLFNNGVDNGFTYHSGFDNAMVPLHFSKNITISDSKKTRIEIWIDYKKMFDEGGGAAMDIPNYPQIHNASLLMLSFVNRFRLAVAVK